MRIPLFLLGLLVAGRVWAEPDTFGFGTGRHDRLRIESAGFVFNRYTLLIADVAPGTSDLSVSSVTGFTAGDLVLIHQSTGLSPAPAAGAQGGIDLNGGAVGRFEYARVASVSPGLLRLTVPLLHGYPARMAQVVGVPEFVELEVRPGASVRAAPWNGEVGGILAVLVTGRLRNDGLITVAGAGFRGGAFLSHANLNGCTGLDEPVASGGSYKGEGLVAGRFGTASGRGNLANGGGGGICHNAGGGGGGHAGSGGAGGRSGPVDGERDVGGLGGASLVYQPYERLLLGGGGGAGAGNNDVGTGGGAGGGLMLIRAGEVRGVGRFLAGGATPPPTAGDDGAGGGGAGGAISIRVAGELECGSVEAPGGAGGDVSERSFPLGPGGGGGGGVVLLQGSSILCSNSVLAGAPGRVATDGGTHGAGPSTGEGGTSTGSARVLSSSFRMPGSPMLTQPADGTPQVGPTPRIEGQAEPGVPHVLLVLDGTFLARVAPDAEGRFTYDVTSELSLGSHELSAYAELLGVHSTRSASHRFVVVKASEVPLPPEQLPELLPVDLQVGCGCGSSPAAGLWAGTLLLAAWFRRATARRRAGGTPRSG
jgi:hypothetical protein